MTSAGPPAKRQKMSIVGEEIQGFESKVIAATAPPLFLDPVADLEEAHSVLEKLTDPLHREKYPSPKTRKRTVAELAADERIAAQEQAFMLIMDEKAGANLAAGKVSTSDEIGATPFEPRFERFNTIQNIKQRHEEQARAQEQSKKRREAEAARHEQTLKASRAQKETQERLERESKVQLTANQQANMRLIQQRKERAHQARQQHLANQNGMNHSQSNGVLPNGYSQAQHSSPIIRNGTPHSTASPASGNIALQAGGVPMQATSSGQGSSPGRPPSSMQHNHPPTGGIAMVHQRSRQQNPSRAGTPQMNGTPHMPNSTPKIPHSTPVLGQGTPTSRMPHGSPQNVAHTPAINHSVMANRQVPQQMSAEQYQAQVRASQQQYLTQQQVVQQQQQQQQAIMQQRQMQQQNSQMSPNGPVSSQQLAVQQHREAVLRQQNAVMNGMHGHPNMPNSASPPIPQQPNGNASHPSQPQPGQQRAINQQHPGQPQQLAAHQQRPTQILKENYLRIGQQMAQAAGLAHPTQLSQAQQMEAHARAKQQTQGRMVRMKMEQQQQQQRQRQNAHIHQQMNILAQQRHQAAHSGGVAPGMGGIMNGGQSMGGQAQGQGPGGQGLSREQQQQQQIMMQMGHLGQGANGMGMNGM